MTSDEKDRILNFTTMRQFVDEMSRINKQVDFHCSEIGTKLISDMLYIMAAMILRI